MSCFPESTYSIYADGELGADETRLVETHLVSCRSCRVLVSALRDEITVLGDVLHEREPAWQSAPARVTPTPDVTYGLPAMIGAVTLLVAVVGALIEMRWPSGLHLLNPLRLKGAFEMAFDLLFALREQAPGLAELALALGVVAGVSAVGSFALGAIYQRMSGSTALIVLAALGLAAPDPARAIDVRWDVEEVRIEAGETFPETLATSANYVVIDGILDGDLVVAAERVTIRGTVRGSIYAFVRDFEVLGKIEGSLHLLSRRARIDGEVDGGVIAACDDFSLGDDGRTRWDVFLWSELAAFDGEVGRDVGFVGESLELRGKVGRNVHVMHADRLALRDGARIAGDVDAELRSEKIDVSPGAVVDGEIRRTDPEPIHDGYLARYTDPGFYIFLVIRFAAAFVFGMALYALIPKLFAARLDDRSVFFRSLGAGFLCAVATPIAILCCGLTVIGIPVAVLATCGYVAALYSANVAVGALIGRALVGGDEGWMPFGSALLAGLGVLYAAESVPFLGPAVGIVSVLFGLGWIYLRARDEAGFGLASG